MDRSIAGIVLAGGKSERMGRNKALLDYKGRPLIEHMKQTLENAGCCSVYISGTVEGYDAIPDDMAYEGPGRAMSGLLQQFRGRHDALLFVPVDMPLLMPGDLESLMRVGKTACYADNPLPAIVYLETPIPDGGRSVRSMLEKAGVVALDLQPGQEKRMLNANTPDEWRNALK